MADIKTYTAYGANKQLWDFLAASYDGGPDYKFAKDANGQPVFITHELERWDRSMRRLRHATYKNYSRTIADKFRDYVYRQEIAWPEAQEGSRLQDFLTDCDLDGTSLQQYCRNATKMAQVFGEVLVGFDSSPIPANEKAATRAQANATGQRLYLTLTDIRRMVDYECDGDAFTRIVIEETERVKRDITDEEKNITRYIQWKLDEWVRFDDKGVAIEMGSNEFGVVPFWKYRHNSDSRSQILDISECSRKTFNLSSLLDEELYSRTFSQVWISGENIQKGSLEEVVGGNSNVIVIPGTGVNVEIRGADPEQAASILKAINAEIKEIWRQAGIESGDPTEVGQPESGTARAWAFHSTEQQLAGIAESAEGMVNNLLDQLAAQGAIEDNPSPAVFPRKFDVTTLQDDIKNAVELFTLDLMPLTAKKEINRRVIQKALSRLPEKVMDQINKELDEMEEVEFDFSANQENFGKD